MINTGKYYGTMQEKMNRCEWSSNDELMIKYHDEEWGMPVHDDKILFEFIVLESAQAGLSWKTILHKRENYRKAFHDFDYEKIAKYTSKDFDRLIKNPGIIRNRLKILATINNAQRFIEVRKEFGTFDKYIWSFVNNKPMINRFKSLKELPAKTTSFSPMTSIHLLTSCMSVTVSYCASSGLSDQPNPFMSSAQT